MQVQKPIISLMVSQDDLCAWRVDLSITGLSEEVLALGFEKMLEDLLCGEEIKVN